MSISEDFNRYYFYPYARYLLYIFYYVLAAVGIVATVNIMIFSGQLPLIPLLITAIAFTLIGHEKNVLKMAFQPKVHDDNAYIAREYL